MLSMICKRLVYFSETLLNPYKESQMMDGARDEEIYQAVLAMRNAQEEGPINGRDADVEDELTTCALPYMS